MKYDVAIIGGGIVGLSAAYRLALHGLRVIVIEKECLGCGATGKAAGVITRQLFLKHDIEFVNESIKFIKQLEKETGKEISKKVNSLLISTVDKENCLKAIINQYSQLKIEHEILHYNELRKAYQVFKFNENEIGILVFNDLIVNPLDLVNLLRSKLIKLGVNITESSLAKLKSYENNVKVIVNNNFIESKDVVVTAGAETKNVIKDLGIELPQILYRCQVYVFRTDKEFPNLFLHDLVNHVYLVKESKETLLAGDGRYEVVDLFIEGLRSSSLIFNDVIEGLLNRVHEDVNLELGSSWSFPCEVSPDGFPKLGRLKPFNNLYVAYGFDGYGYMRGSALGFRLADLLLGKNRDLMNKYPFIFNIEDIFKHPNKSQVYEFHTPLCLLK